MILQGRKEQERKEQERVVIKHNTKIYTAVRYIEMKIGNK